MITDFKVGDRVRATLGENVLVGSVEVVSCRDRRVRLVFDNKQTFWVSEYDGWHIEKVSPPLPTKVGAIVRRADGALFVRDVVVRGAPHLQWLALDGTAGAWSDSTSSDNGFEVIFEGVDA